MRKDLPIPSFVLGRFGHFGTIFTRESLLAVVNSQPFHQQSVQVYSCLALRIVDHQRTPPLTSFEDPDIAANVSNVFHFYRQVFPNQSDKAIGFEADKWP